jgi:hypothetical protein
MVALVDHGKHGATQSLSAVDSFVACDGSDQLHCRLRRVGSALISSWQRRSSEGWSRVRLCPVGRHVIVLIGLCFPVTIRPGIITESRRVLKLLLGDAGYIAVEFGIVLQGSPRDRIMAMAETEKATETHDGVGNPT